MKTFINKIFLAVVAIVLVAGTALFTSCEKKNEKRSRETINNNSKSEINDELYNSLLKKHDCSISVVGDEINYTVFGRLDTNLVGIREYVDEVLYEGMMYITEDENIFSMSKIDENTIDLQVENLTSDKYRITLGEVKQNKDTLNFSLKHNDKHIAYCSLKLPNGTENFMDILPITLNEDAKIHPAVVVALKIAGSFLVGVAASIVAGEIMDNDNYDERKAERCYAEMREQARMCYSNGGYFWARHGENHNGCEHSCKK